MDSVSNSKKVAINHTNIMQPEEERGRHSQDILKAKIHAILRKGVEHVQSIDSKELVKRALVGTPDEKK